MAFTQKGNLKKHAARWHTMNAPKSRRKVVTKENQEERFVIKGLESNNDATSDKMMTCSVVIPPSFLTNNKEVVVTNVPISMAAMLKQKATEVANAAEPSSVTVTSLIQCLTASQKAAATKTPTADQVQLKTVKQKEGVQQNKAPTTVAPPMAQADESVVSSSFQDTLASLTALSASKQAFPVLTIPSVSNFMRLHDPNPTSCAPSYPVDMMKSFLAASKSAPAADIKQGAGLFPEQQSTPETSKDIHSVQEILGGSALLDISGQKASTASSSGLNFSGDFTGQVRGLEFTQADTNAGRFRYPMRNPMNR